MEIANAFMGHNEDDVILMFNKKRQTTTDIPEVGTPSRELMNYLKELTPEEKEGVINVLAERMKDVIFANAQDRARQILQEIIDLKVKRNDTITFHYKINMLGNDVIEAIGAVKRRV